VSHFLLIYNKWLNIYIYSSEAETTFSPYAICNGEAKTELLISKKL